MATNIGSMEQEYSRNVPRNVGRTERWISAGAGAVLLVAGLRKRSLTGLLGAAVGGGLLVRGLTGRCAAYAALGLDTSAESFRPSEEPSSMRIPPESAISSEPPDMVDEASMESFPASDPPAYTPRRA